MKKAKYNVIALIFLLVLSGCEPAAKENPAFTPEAENTPGITPTEKNTPHSIPTASSCSIEDVKDSLDPDETAGKAEKNNNVPKAESIFSYDKDFTRSWYLYINDGLGQKDIETSIKESNAVAEYRVVYNIALLGYYYYTLQVYKNGTGKFNYIAHLGEQFEDGRLLLNKASILSKNDTDMLLKAIKENDFWNIPTVHPDEELGCDGTTVFIEGYSNGNTHFIHMWEPGKEYGIYKILKAFKDYSTKIAENPFDKVEFDEYGDWI